MGEQRTEKTADFSDLMRRVREGSEEAAWELVHCYGERIRRVVRRKMSHRLRPVFDSLDFVRTVGVRPAQSAQSGSGRNLLLYKVGATLPLVGPLSSTGSAAAVRPALFARFFGTMESSDCRTLSVSFAFGERPHTDRFVVACRERVPRGWRDGKGILRHGSKTGTGTSRSQVLLGIRVHLLGASPLF
jgi:hypothetical protein